MPHAKYKNYWPYGFEEHFEKKNREPSGPADVGHKKKVEQALQRSSLQCHVLHTSALELVVLEKTI